MPLIYYQNISGGSKFFIELVPIHVHITNRLINRGLILMGSFGFDYFFGWGGGHKHHIIFFFFFSFRIIVPVISKKFWNLGGAFSKGATDWSDCNDTFVRLLFKMNRCRGTRLFRYSIVVSLIFFIIFSPPFANVLKYIIILCIHPVVVQCLFFSFPPRRFRNLFNDRFPI